MLNIIFTLISLSIGIVIGSAIMRHSNITGVSFKCSCGGKYNLVSEDDSFRYYECDKCGNIYKDVKRKDR